MKLSSTRVVKSVVAAVCAVGFLGAGSWCAANEGDEGLAVEAHPVSTVAIAEPMAAPLPHCEVPCGIYADEMRFQMMLEDTATILKAINSVRDICEGFHDAGPPDAKTVNQMTRWITTKEQHATNTQHIMAQYFLTQRIKPDNEKYAMQLKAAHAVMVAAMKCKQDADPATAQKLHAAILDFYRAYEGKEPKFDNGDHK